VNTPRIAADRRGMVVAAALVAILVLALALRLYGLEWDARGLFHPDERQVLAVVDRLALPTWSLLLTPASPLNPGFFAYGSLPLYLLKAVSAALALLGGDWADPDRLCLIGRGLVAVSDTGTVLLVFLLGRRLHGSATGLLAALFLALAVLHVQAAHFYTVDPILAFLTVLTMLLAGPVAERGDRRWGIMAGGTWGLALATKVNAVLLVVPLAGAWMLGTPRLRQGLIGLVLTAGVALGVFLATEPYALIDAPTFVQQTLNEIAIARGTVIFPYTVQYQGTIPWLYFIWQTAWWGLGLPLGLVAWGGLVGLTAWAWRGHRAAMVLWTWVLVYFAIMGASFAKPVRYMLPLTPFLCLAGASLLVKPPAQRLVPPNQVASLISRLVTAIIIGLTALYALAFVAGVYGREHPWLTVSAWVYRHVPAGATIAVETWEHGLPVEMTIDGQHRLPGEYTIRELDLHGAQDEAARAQLAENLATCDVMILASRRGYLPLTRQATVYPLAARFYTRLFHGDLGFELATWARTGPALGNLLLADDPVAAAGLPPLPGLARPGELVLLLPLPDESLVVYDHPLPLVFRRVRPLSLAQLDRLLQSSDAAGR